MKRREFMIGTAAFAGAAALGVEASANTRRSSPWFRVTRLLLGDELYDALRIDSVNGLAFGPLWPGFNKRVRRMPVMRFIADDCLCVPSLCLDTSWLTMNDADVLRLSGSETVAFVLVRWTPKGGGRSFHLRHFSYAETRAFGGAIYRDMVNFGDRRTTRWRWPGSTNLPVLDRI